MLAYILQDSEEFGLKAKQVIDTSPARVDVLCEKGVASKEWPPAGVKKPATKKVATKKQSGKR